MRDLPALWRCRRSVRCIRGVQAPAYLMMSMSRHGEAGAVDHAADVAVELDVVEGLYF